MSDFRLSDDRRCTRTAATRPTGCSTGIPDVRLSVRVADRHPLVHDQLTSMFPVKYRWPVFALDATPEQDYHAIIDEEGKVRGGRRT